MQPDLAFKAISNLTIAISLLAMLFILLIALRKELIGSEPFRGVVQLGLAVIGICMFIALMSAYVQVRKVIVPGSISHRLDTAAVSQPAGTKTINLRDERKTP